MTRFIAWIVAVLLVVGTLSTAVVLGGQQLRPSQVTAADVVGNDHGDSPAVVREGTSAGAAGERRGQMDNGSNGSAPSGGFVSSVIGMEDASVDAEVTIARFETRFSAARTDEARAAVIASSLNASRMQVSMLEMRLDTLETRRMNGSISPGWFAVELSWLLSTAENRRQVVARLERAAGTVPDDELAKRNASVEQILRVQQRVDRLLATENPDIHRTTFDRQFYRDFPPFVERFNERADPEASGTFGNLFDDERVNLYVESDAGPASVISFRTTDDARIRDLRAGQRPDATVRMRMDEETARRLLSAEDPWRVLATALVRGEVTIRGIGVVNGLKWGVRGIVLVVVRALIGVIEELANVF